MSRDRASPPPPRCLIEVLSDAMEKDSSLEAVRIDRQQRSVSVATIGPAGDQPATAALSEQIQRLGKIESPDRCALFDGMGSCEPCRITPQVGKIGRLEIRHENGTTIVSRPTCPTAPRFWRWHEVLLPKLVPRELLLPEEPGHEQEWKAQIAAAAGCGGFALAGLLAGGGVWAIALYSAAYLSGAWFTVAEVWERLQKRVLDIHFLMLAVAIGSASIGAWGEGAMLLFLFSFSGALEHYAMGRTHREIHALFKSAPKTARLMDEQGLESELPVSTVRPGMRLLIRPSEQFPVDAEIVKGRTAADESNLTGESTPVDKNIGDSVLAGTLNLWGAIEAVALRPAQESALQRIIRLIREAQHLKAPAQQFADRFSSPYTYGVLGASAVMFFVWWLGFGLDPMVSGATEKSAFYRAMTLLVVASPCALVLSIPSAVLAAIAWAARRGILFRGGAAVERLAEVDTVAMDKTGTLTTGEPRVETIQSFPAGRDAEVIELAFSLERLSTHPLARAITRFGKQQQLQPVELDHLESVPGLGMSAQFKGQPVLLGRREWLETGPHPVALPPTPTAEPGQSEIWIAHGGLVGRILLRDEPRPQARAVVEKLNDLGLHTLILTGDRALTAERFKAQVPVDDVRAELKPEDKVAVIRAMADGGRKVAMIGDGVNDAPSLTLAHVGVAMGARGSDAALEQAEIVLMHDRLENFLTAYLLSRRARRIIRQNLFISLGTVAVLVAFALGGGIPLAIGVAGHEGSTVVVVMNSLRLLLSGEKSHDR